MSAIEKHKSPVWCTIFGGPDGCYHVDWGHPKGQPLSFKTVEMLSKKYLEKHKHKYAYIWFIIGTSYLDRFRDQMFINCAFGREQELAANRK